MDSKYLILSSCAPKPGGQLKQHRYKHKLWMALSKLRSVPFHNSCCSLGFAARLTALVGWTGPRALRLMFGQKEPQIIGEKINTLDAQPGIDCRVRLSGYQEPFRLPRLGDARPASRNGGPFRQPGDLGAPAASRPDLLYSIEYSASPFSHDLSLVIGRSAWSCLGDPSNLPSRRCIRLSPPTTYPAWPYLFATRIRIRTTSRSRQGHADARTPQDLIPRGRNASVPPRRMLFPIRKPPLLHPATPRP